MRLLRRTGGLELCIPHGLTQVAAHTHPHRSGLLCFSAKRIVYRGQGDSERGGTWDENKRKSYLLSVKYYISVCVRAVSVCVCVCVCLRVGSGKCEPNRIEN